MLFKCVGYPMPAVVGQLGSHGAKIHLFLLHMFLPLHLAICLSLVITGFGVSLWGVPHVTLLAANLLGNLGTVSCCNRSWDIYGVVGEANMPIYPHRGAKWKGYRVCTEGRGPLSTGLCRGPTWCAYFGRRGTYLCP